MSTRQALVNPSHSKRAAPALREPARPRRIQNRVYRQCAMDGFNARIAAQLAGAVPAAVPLYSHHSTRQSYFAQGWQAVTPVHILRATARVTLINNQLDNQREQP